MTYEHPNASHRISSGMLGAPEFGEITDLYAFKRQDVKGDKYRPLLAVIREHEGRWAKVAVFRIGSKEGPAMTKERSMTLARNEKSYLVAFVRNEFPLERWKVSQRTTPDTWGDREVWVRYDGTWTEEERATDERTRKAQHKWRTDLATRAKQEKQAKAKAEILEMQSRRGGGKAK